MGLYPIECPSCKTVHMWFSGNMDQRCESCKKHKEWWIFSKLGHSDHVAKVQPQHAEAAEYIHVIEKSAYDAKCKQAEDIIKDLNELREYFRELVDDLQTQVSIEKGEVARLMAVAKRRNKR